MSRRIAPAGESVLDKLKKLGELKEAGVLSEEEFAAQKVKLMEDLLGRALDLITSRLGVGAPSTRDSNVCGASIFVAPGTSSTYQVHDDETVEVLAFWHASRGEGPPLAFPV